eukprot:CAMPEP_0116146152 /NCGR_PEP_ID=MMETSP0329-20121206/17009_1 /TAXON_ID=697910 /ORGANISM="Pseudo-nitzschia arenysensis, Strain B593" /LENGTH=1016 /DNA_ID=CAMNT_0003641875 /DNA_START=710 /DNA_END=3760 /DNA_ORIENTATION=-
MPLQVSSTPTSSLLLSSMIPNDVRESNVMSESSSSGTNASPAFMGGAAVGGVRPIVVNAVETQNSLGGENIPNSTCSTGSPVESRHAKKFSEHRKTINTDTPPNSDVQHAQHSLFAQQQQQQQQQQHSTANYSLSHLFHDIEDKHNDTIIKHTIGSTDLSRSGGLNSSSGRTQISVEEDRNREHHHGFSTIENPENPSHTNRRRGFESNYLQQQQKHALAALQHLPQPPPQYTATAAQIALGISNPYGQNHSMGDGSRVNSLISYSELHGETKRDNLPFHGKETDEDASRTSASTDTMSPGRRTPIHDSSNDRIIVGTPSTASTAPSSDDEALVDYKLDDTSTLPKLLHPIHPSQGTLGEDVMFSVHDSRQPIQELQRNQNPWVQQSLPTNSYNISNPSFAGRLPLNAPHYPLQQQSQQRVASFRHEGNVVERRRNDDQVHQNQSQRFQAQHYPHPNHLYQQQQQQQQQQQRMQTPPANRKFPYSYHPAPKISTPPRTVRNQRQQGNKQAASPNPHQTGSSLQRSSSEVLKTLLRKKACLYEPNTSRAVALVTWLVGRLLALEFGFFSRQQLQSGVHACVSNKIEAGTITRTKVNRCMQIILNSCFHYIIPRSDGTEENGDYFRDSFAATVEDDSLLLKELAEPWNDLVVDRDTVIHAILQDVEERNSNQSSSSNQSPSISPRHSPKLSSMNAEKNPERYFIDGEKEEASKRAVLLCFNENVRSAEDVFRCHNDFIRDTANASHLQLSAQEWSQFFGLEALRDPQFLGNVGVSMLTGSTPGGAQAPPDLLGRMSQAELAKFRTTWCTKRYEHDHDLCGFAHIEVNGGWLRRNPMKHTYKNEMCKHVTKETCKLVNPAGEEVVSHFLLNECPNGLACDHAHSMEEIDYHPLNYKSRVCTHPYTRPGGCRLGDVCPNAHPPDSNRPFKKLTADGRSPDKRGKKNFDQGKSNAKSWATTVPSGSPIVYASPAPISKFEQQLGMPGLQNLFRRQSEVIRDYVRSSGKSQPAYSLFEDTVA